jgi:hypothetical protein
MDLRIKRFTVRYEGEDYGPGNVIYGVPEKMAKKLVAESNGEIEELPPRVENVPAGETGGNHQLDQKADGDVDTGQTGVGLPQVDPGKTVK